MFVTKKKYKEVESYLDAARDVIKHNSSYYAAKLAKKDEDYAKLLAELETQVKDNVRLSTMYEKREKDAKEEERSRWAPLLKRLMSISADRNPEYGYRLSVTFDNYITDAVASYNSNHYWDYFADMAAYELKRQLLTLNFAGLHKMAQDKENRFRKEYPYAFAPSLTAPKEKV